MTKPKAPVTDVVVADDEPPTELNKRREMIRSAVEAAANGVMRDIKSLRAQLDELETLVIQSADRNIESLNAHVGICEAAQIEVNRVSGVVAEMRKTQISKAHTNGERPSVL
jgi:hypothetical protein